MEVRPISQTLVANARTHFPMSGRYFRLLSTVNPVTVEAGRGGIAVAKIDSIEAGIAIKLRPDQAEFTDLWITATGNEAISAIVSDGEVTYDRVFVQYAQARTLTLPGTVTVGAAEVVVLAASTRSKIWLMSDPANTDEIMVGPAGVTLALSPIRLAPGDMANEEIAASAAWKAISGSAGQLLRVMTAA